MKYVRSFLMAIGIWFLVFAIPTMAGVIFDSENLLLMGVLFMFSPFTSIPVLLVIFAIIVFLERRKS